MKKVIMIMVAAFMVLACGNKSQDPYTKYLDQAFEAMEKGDYEQAEQLLMEYEAWFAELDESEIEVAAVKLEQWYEANGDKFETMYEKYLDEIGVLYDDVDYEEMFDAYDELLDEYDEEDLEEAYEKAIDAYEDALDDALDKLDW